MTEVEELRTAKRSAGPDEVLRLDGVSKSYRLRRRSLRDAPTTVHAVRDVSLVLHRGETLGLVGESGCGKSTLGRIALTMLAPDGGRVLVGGVDAARPRRAARRRMRRSVQAVYQDPNAALDPRRTIGRSIAEPLRAGGMGRADTRREVARLMTLVGLDPDRAGARPRELSGGLRQRVVIARALATAPELLIADEPVSALDVSVQAQIVNLLRDLQETRQLAMVFISHDLAVVSVVAERIAVMYLGRIVETGVAGEVLTDPRHPYTLLLREASLHTAGAVDADVEREPERAEADGAAADGGCAFRLRCPFADDVCVHEEPVLQPASDGRVVACHHPR